MIPSKLYIPTSSQNFNSIMSSESISPACFYERRNFGMKRFIRVEANNLSDRIILYSDIPQFTIPASDEDNFPIYIEIQTDCYEEGMFYQSEEDGAYYCDCTIYITPYNCKFFLFGESSFRTVYSSQKRSLTTKMTRLYAGNFYPIGNIPIKQYDYSLFSNSGKDISQYIALDRRINKLKGFYLAYVIGLMKDLSPSMVHLYNLTNQISDTLASTLTSTHTTISQSVQIDYLYEQINKSLKEESKEKELIDEAIKEDSKKYGLVGDLLSYVKIHGWFNDWKKQKNIPETYQVLPFVKSFSESVSDQETKDHYIENIMKNLSKMRGKNYPSIDELPQINQYSLSVIPETGFLEFVFKELLQEIYNGDFFVSSRYQFSLALCKQYKSTVNEEEFALVRDYLNALNKNLNSYEQFNINGTDVEDLKAFAAFCQKGDTDDYGKLEDHMIKSEIGSLHKGFALAGIVFGYADMPKTFTASLTYDSNKDFIKSVYKSLTNHMGVDISNITSDVKIADKDLSAPTNPKLYDEIKDVLRPLNLPDATRRKIEDAIEVEQRQYNPQALWEILNNLLSRGTVVYKKYQKFFNDHPESYPDYKSFRDDIRHIYSQLDKRQKKDEYWKAIEVALELEAKVGDPLAFMTILDDHLSTKDKAYRVLAAHFGVGIQKNTITKATTQMALFTSNDDYTRDYKPKAKRLINQELLIDGKSNPKSIFHDLSWIDVTANLINELERDSYIENVDWFVVNYSYTYIDEKGDKQNGRYIKKGEIVTNKSIIEHIAKFFRKHIDDKRVSISWKDIEKIVEYLQKHFHD